MGILRYFGRTPTNWKYSHIVKVFPHCARTTTLWGYFHIVGVLRHCESTPPMCCPSQAMQQGRNHGEIFGMPFELATDEAIVARIKQASVTRALVDVFGAIKSHGTDKVKLRRSLLKGAAVFKEPPLSIEDLPKVVGKDPRGHRIPAFVGSQTVRGLPILDAFVARQ